ncbi:MAG: AAA family ATPase [Thermoguttaceae bacterium]|nr:AAA family ATPase [Thermoguttaceae bacterium]MDW8038180.1 AAA family ATPase [Thermoguttaceae bacterium]
MKLRAIHVEGFGVWHRLRLEGFQDGLNLIYGPNEAGKTTLLEFVRSILYGFTSAWDSFLPPVRSARAGGWLEVVRPEGVFRIQRLLEQQQLEESTTLGPVRSADGRGLIYCSHKYSSELAPNSSISQNSSSVSGMAETALAARLGHLRILGPHGIVEEGNRLVEWLAGVDESLYQNVFAIGLRQLQELALLSRTEAARLLYALSTGLEGANLVQVREELEQARRRLLAPTDQPCVLGELLARREKLRRQIQTAQQTASQYPHLLAQRDQTNQQAQQLQAELSQLQKQRRLVEAALALRDRLQQRAQLDAQLTSLPPGKPVSAEMLQQYETIHQAIQEHQRHMAQLRSQLAQLRHELASWQVDKQIIKYSAQIRALVEQLSWLQQLEDRLASLQEQIGLLEAKCAEVAQQVGFSEGELAEGLVATVSSGQPGLVQRLRAPAARIRQLRRQMQQARQQAAVARQTAQALQDQLHQALANRAAQDLTTAIDQTSQQLANLRRRQQIEDQLVQIQRQQAELARQTQRLAAKQTRPIAVQIACTALLLVGASLVFWGGILPGLGIGNWQLTWAAVGLLLAVSSLVGNLLLQHHHRRQQLTCSQQRKMLHRQLTQLLEERRALDAVIPSGPGSLAERIEALQQELALLEQLTPLDTRRQAAWQKVQSAEANLQHCQQELEAAYQRWKETLELLGLPAHLSAARAFRLQADVERLAELQQRLQQTRQQYNQDLQQWEGLRNRIRQLAEQIGLPPAQLNPIELVRLMAERLNAEEAGRQQRGQLRRQLRAVRQEARRLQRQLARLLRQRRRLFRQADVKTEQAFRQRAAQTLQAQQLTLQRQALQREIEAALPEDMREEDLAPYLQTPADLPTQQAQLTDRIAQLTQQLQACYERRGQLNEQLRQLAEDRTLPELRQQWDQLQREIAQTSHRWQVLALTSRLLDELRRRYERQYQPETLLEASEYFCRMSSGRYRRVWRPLDKEELWVDLAEGQSLPVERLSQGTRELLYLSLRLALVAAYARRGIRLPMILDDVLVNFDTNRAKATAELLREFALQGHQILLFTCHEHLQRLFQELRTPQATLPDWSQQPLPRVRLEIPSGESVLPVQKSRQRKSALAAPHCPEEPHDASGPEEPANEEKETETDSGSTDLVLAEAQTPGKITEPEIAASEQSDRKPASPEGSLATSPSEVQPDLSSPENDFQWYETLSEEEQEQSDIPPASAHRPNAEAA